MPHGCSTIPETLPVASIKLPASPVGGVNSTPTTLPSVVCCLRPTPIRALAMLMSVMQAPVAKLVRTLNEVPGKLVRTVAAVRDAKQAAE